MSQNYRYPASSTVSISAIGTNGASAPLTSIQVAGETAGGVLEPLLVDANGQLIIDVITSGGATAANQVLEIAELTGIHTDTTAIKGQLPATLGQKAMAASLAVAFASDQSALAVTGPLTDTQLRATAVPVSAAALPLPSGAATSGLQTTGNTSLASIDGKFGSLGQKAMAGSAPVVLASDQSALPVTVASLPLPSGAATESTLSTLNGKVTACNTGAVVVSSSALPSGAATESTLSTLSGKFGSLGQKAMSGSAPVVIASDQAAIPVTPSAVVGRAKANAPVLNDYTSVPVTSGAYVQLIASTTSTANMIEIFDSSGQTIYLAVGGAGSEVIQMIITPGGNGQVPLAIPSGSRVAVKAFSTSATVGVLVLNLYT